MIPVCEPTLDGKELELVSKAVKSGWISSSGKYIKQFEEKFADYCGVKYGIACTSGTTALHLAIEAMKIGRGDEVITPTFSMAATTNAILYAFILQLIIFCIIQFFELREISREKKNIK